MCFNNFKEYQETTAFHQNGASLRFYVLIWQYFDRKYPSVECEQQAAHFEGLFAHQF